MTRVSVVVVSWNGLALTQRCLDSLRGQTGPDDDLEVELVVVDNGSTDGTARALRDVPDVRLVALPTNTGFAGGVNAGVRATSGDVVVLLNNDAVATPGFLRALVAPLRAAAGGSDAPGGGRVGATTGRVLLSGRFVPADAGAGDDGATVLVAADGRRWRRADDGATLVNSTGNELTTAGNGRDRDWLAPADAVARAEVFGFNGGCAALARAALADVGLLEESFFMYYEDTELSWRLRRRGWTVRHVPEAVTVHDHAASSGTASAFFLDHNERNRLLVALVHAPWAVVLRASGRAVVRAALGPERARRARVLASVVARVPWALRRRAAVDRTARVPRAEVAALLVPNGAPR